MTSTAEFRASGSDAHTNGNGSNGHGPRHNGARPARVPPHNLDAEASLLGAMLLSREATAAALDACTPGDFYRPAHGHVFAALGDLYSHGEPTDVATVADLLGRRGLLELMGGGQFLNALVAVTPATSHAGRYARIVADHALLRRLIGAAGEISEMGYGTPEDVTSALDGAEALLFAVADSRRLQREVAPMSESLRRWLDDLEVRIEHGSSMGILTGWPDIDEMLLGFQPGQLITVAARPSMGKTAWAVSLTLQVSLEARRPVLYFSIEMSEDELMGRAMASESRVDQQRLRSAKLKEADWPKLSLALGRLGESEPVLIDDSPVQTLFSMRSTLRRVVARYGSPVVIVDYLQLLSGTGRAENRQVEVAEFARGLKVMAREMSVPVVALAQLNRNLEQRADKRPVLSDLRESGEIENSSDVVAFLYRDEVYNSDSPDRGTAEFIVAKQRNGPIGTARLAFLNHFGRFASMARM